MRSAQIQGLPRMWVRSGRSNGAVIPVLSRSLMKKRSSSQRCCRMVFLRRQRLECLQRSVLAAVHDDDDLIELAGRMRHLRVPARKVVYAPGDDAKFVAFVESGEFEHFSTDESVLGTATPGDIVGCEAVERNAKRVTGLRSTATGGSLFIVSVNELETLIKGFQEQAPGQPIAIAEYLRTAKAPEDVLGSTPLFNGLTRNHMAVIAFAMKYRGVPRGTVVLREGDDGDSMFVVQSGALEAVTGDRTLNRFARGDYFGELALLLQMPRTADVVAVEPAIVLELRKVDLDRILGNNEPSFQHATVPGA